MTGQRLRKYALSILAGSAAFLVLAEVASMSNVRGFENPDPGWFEKTTVLWFLLQLSLPGAVAGLLAPSRALICGTVAYALGGLLILGFEIGESYGILGRLLPGFLTDWIGRLLFMCAIGGVIAQGVAYVRRRRSSNNALDQARGR